jgi:phosphoglycerate dehydrogenase-like enzyme
MTHQLVFLGHAARGYRGLIEPHLTTPWETRFVEEDDAPRHLATAEAVVGMAFDNRHRHATRVRLIQVPGAGCDRIDWSAVPPSATVCNAFEHETACAEYVLLAMLEWAIQLRRADAAIRAGDWTRSARFAGLPGNEIQCKTVGIVGLGRIGRAIATRARALAMAVLAANRTPRDPDDTIDAVVPLSELPAMAAKSDFLVVCCALVPMTRGLVDAAVLAAMRPTAVVINVARGPVIDEDAMWNALSQRRIGGAVIDVWWQNPPDLLTPVRPSRYPFEELDNVIMSPHIAGWTTGTIERRALFIAGNLDRLARGEALQNVVART